MAFDRFVRQIIHPLDDSRLYIYADLARMVHATTESHNIAMDEG